jgi:hypothetical protein
VREVGGGEAATADDATTMKATLYHVVPVSEHDAEVEAEAASPVEQDSGETPTPAVKYGVHVACIQ